MSDDLIDLPLGDDDAEPTFPTDEPEERGAAAARHGRLRRRRRPRRGLPHVRPLWLLVIGVLLVAAAWLYWRPSKLELSPGQPASIAAPVGETGEPVEIEIRNTGRRKIAIQDIRVTGDEGFSIGVRECGQVLDAHQSCRVQVVLVPSALGAVNGQLEVAGNQRGGVNAVALTGEGLGAQMVADRAQVEFESTPVEGTSSPQELRISNQGTLAGSPGRVSIEGADFRLSSNHCQTTLEPGESCAIEVVFQPRRLGDREGRLIADGDVARPLPAIALRGRGSGPGFEIRPARLAFGEHKVGTSSPPLEIVWLNQGDEQWRLSSPRIEGESFRLLGSTCDQSSVPVNGSCRARIAFSPSKAGAAAADLVLVHRSGERFPPAELTGTGTAPRLALDLRRVNFPVTPVGRTSPPRTLRLTNSGTADAELSAIRIGGAAASSFRLESECGSSLAVGATCVLRVELAPTGSGEMSASLIVESDAPGSPLTLTLVGDGSRPRLALSRDRLDFATVPQGESQELQLAIENPGSAPLEVNGLMLDGTGFAVLGDDCSGRMIVAGGDCAVVLRFQPAAPGAHTGRLRVLSAAGEATVSLSGLAGEPPVPSARVTPGQVVFDPTRPGGRSPAETITLASSGPGRMTIASVTIEGEAPESFRLVPATCGDVGQLLAGSQCTIGVRFQPASAGDHEAEVVIRSNAAPAQLRVRLRGQTAP